MIWLASFPRSGNTFFRNVLFEVYGIESSTYHKDDSRELDENFDEYKVIKTHLLPSDLPTNLKNRKAVYLVRDGRDALVSMAHHRKDIIELGSDFYNNLLTSIIAPKGSYFGGWSENVKQWSHEAAIIIRFEDLIKNPIQEVEKLRAIMDLPQPDLSKLPSFKDLKFGHPKYGGGSGDQFNANITKKNFRKGKAGGWKEEMPTELHSFFCTVHREMMEQTGYLDGLTTTEAGTKKRILIEVSKLYNPANDGVKRYLLELVNHLSYILQYLPDWEIDVLNMYDIQPLRLIENTFSMEEAIYKVVPTREEEEQLEIEEEELVVEEIEEEEIVTEEEEVVVVEEVKEVAIQVNEEVFVQEVIPPRVPLFDKIMLGLKAFIKRQLAPHTYNKLSSIYKALPIRPVLWFITHFHLYIIGFFRGIAKLIRTIINFIIDSFKYLKELIVQRFIRDFLFGYLKDSANRQIEKFIAFSKRQMERFGDFLIKKKEQIHALIRKFEIFVAGIIHEWRLRKMLNKLHEKVEVYDLIHIPLPQNFKPFKRSKSNFIVTAHDITHKLFPEYHTEVNAQNAESGMQVLVKKKPHIIAISEATKNDLIEHYSVPEKKISVVYEGATGKFNRDNKSKPIDGILEKYNLPKQPFFITLSTLEPRKNIVNTIKAFRQLKANQPSLDIALFICGKRGWKYDSIIAGDDDEMQKEGIYFTGFVADADLPILFAQARALCYISHYEGFGLPLLEAMQCGTPVIYGDNSSMPEVAGRGGIGVDTNDLEAITKAMESLAASNDLYEELAEKAWQQAAKFSWLKAAFETLNAYETAINDLK